MATEENSIVRRAAVHRLLGDPSRLAIVEALKLSDRTPGELRALTDADWNLLGFHVQALEDAGVVERHRSEGDGRRRYVRLRPGALDPLTTAPFATPPVQTPHWPVFVCTRNSARSQFAAALWARVTEHEATSAGSHPAPKVHPLAVEVARDHGLDLSRARPCGYNEVSIEPDLVVSVCDRALERGIPFAAPHVHWSVPDPVDGDRASFERAFTDIADRMSRLVEAA